MSIPKTTLLLSLLIVLMVLLGSAIGGEAGMVFAFFMAAAISFFALHMIPLQESRPATAHVSFVTPLTGVKLLSTHLPMAERVARLEGMARGGW